jgi:hypothetical protein
VNDAGQPGMRRQRATLSSESKRPPRITAAPEYIVNTARLIDDVRVVRC